MNGLCCQGGLLNSGLPSCVKTIGVVKGLIVVPLRDDSGSLNGVDLTSVTNTVFNGYISNANASQRFIPWIGFKNVDLPRAETTFETAGNDEKSFLREGLRSFVGELWDKQGHHVIGGKLKKARCAEWGVYLVDEYDQLIGMRSGNMLYPIKVNAQSFDPAYMFKVDATTNKVMWAFDFARPFIEEKLYVVAAHELDADYSFLELRGLIETDLTVSNIADDTTDLTFDVSIATIFAAGLLPNVDVFGLTASNFVVKNETTGTPIVIGAVTGGTQLQPTYSFEVPSQTSGDVVSVTIATASGFVGSATLTNP